MRILFALIFCIFGTKASAEFLNYQDFKQLPSSQQMMILKAYKEFVSSQNLDELGAQTTSLRLSLINEAYAASQFNCFYAGWPSVKKTVRGKSLCHSPSTANPSYKKLAAACRSSELLCNPTLFGSGICVDVSSQSKRNQAFAQCEQKFSSSGKGLSDVVQEINSSNLSSEADELFELVNTTCTSGFQKNTSMCRNLSAKVAKIKETSPKGTVVEQPTTPTPSKTEVEPPKAVVEEPSTPQPPKAEVVVVASNPKAEPTQQTDPVVTPETTTVTHPPKTEQQALIEAAEHATAVNDVVASAGNVLCLPEKEAFNRRPVRQKDPKVPHISCLPEANASPVVMNEDIEKLITDYNISFHPSKEVVTKSVEFRMFLSEFSKYPKHLLKEMADAKAGIRLIIGDSVSDDPDWHTECQRRIQIALNWEKFNNKDNSLSEQTRIGCQKTMDGRSWSENFVSGAGGNFSEKKFITPTRIVLNSLYKNPFRQPDGKVVMQNSGSTNLFLHEHGHAMDSYKGPHSITNSDQWQAVMKDPKVMAYLPKVTTDYEHTYPNEAFAEMFAYYHGCEAARNQVQEQAPALADFFKNMKSMYDYKGTYRHSAHSHSH